MLEWDKKCEYIIIFILSRDFFHSKTQVRCLEMKNTKRKDIQRKVTRYEMVGGGGGLKGQLVDLEMIFICV